MSNHQVSAVIVQSLVNAGVKKVFGVPGAKIDSIFNTLLDFPQIQLVVCRHEQNAAMMAAAYGRITGRPGVCIATSGPGASNLATGLLTATTEGDPVVALIGSVPRSMSNHRTHQTFKSLDVLGPTCKSTLSIDVEDQAAEIILGAFRQAGSLPSGAVTISLPSDVASGMTRFPAFEPSCFQIPLYGCAQENQLVKVIDIVKQSKLVVLCLGMRASNLKVTAAVRHLLQKWPMPTVETFQAAGSLSKDLEHLFYGRVGLFHNQCGDKLLSSADLIIMVGYDPVEYDANVWNPDGKAKIVHIDYQAAEFGNYYQPQVELLGSIAASVDQLGNELAQLGQSKMEIHTSQTLCTLQAEYNAWHDDVKSQRFQGLVHPLTFVRELQKRVMEETVITCDVGTSYIYMMRYMKAYRPRHLLCSNGQQTLGVSLPWAISASLCQNPPCSKKVVAIAGDGGFMFSCQELSTAVLQGCNITIFIWNDQHYNMVEFQEEVRYGRSSGVRLGGVNFEILAGAFGAKAFHVKDAKDLIEVMEKALAHVGVSIVEVSIDYKDAPSLAKDLVKDALV